ncbi:MAG: hypothetical protein IKD72_00885 [Clostridia bacterium]|nr:hypothetical protein [Clostridia bacterium]
MKFRLSMLTDKKVRLAALLVVAALSVAVSGTLAYFMASTHSIRNDFFPARLNVVIHEDFQQIDGSYVKSNVTVENAVVPRASSHAYIRVRLVPTWRDENGNVAGVPPVDLTAPPAGITAEINPDLAFDYVDGYYYYKEILAPGEQTTPLVRRIAVDYAALAGTPYEGYTFELSVLAEGLDAAAGAAEAAWGVVYSAHTWSPCTP